MKTLRISLRVVFYKDGANWVAHCLEFDLVGDGKTTKAALKSLAKAIFIQAEDSLKHQNPANLFSPADSKIFQMFAAGKNIAAGELKIKTESIEIEDVQSREYSEGDLVLA